MEYLLLAFWLFCIVFGCIGLYVGFTYFDFTKSKTETTESKVVKEKHQGAEIIGVPGEKAVGIRASSLPFWLYFIAIAAAELLTVYLQPQAGLICHGIILIAFLIQSAFVSQPQQRNLILALSLVPLIRILSLIMPLAELPQIYWYLIIYTPLLVAAVVVMRVVGLKSRQVGLISRGLPLQIGIGIAAGIAIGITEYYILRPQLLVTEFSLGQIWFPAVVLLITTGFVEELIFRGVLQRTSEVAMGRLGLVYISAIFAILHVGHLSALDVIFVFGIALFFATLVKRTGSLIGVTLSHGIANILLYLIAPFILG